MKFDPKIHHRRSIRLPGYDYSQPGAYFVTMVTHGRECILGKIVEGVMHLSRSGQLVRDAWLDLPCHYPHVRLGHSCIMPNHVHAVIILAEDDNYGRGSLDDHNRRGGSPIGHDDLHSVTIEGTRSIAIPHETRPYKRHALPEIIRAWKSFSAKRINLMNNESGLPVWQRNYYEHILRDDEEYNKIYLHIEANPANWQTDEENRP